jgi:hypothetical protein
MKLNKEYQLQGLIWQNPNGNWCRRCPTCENIIEYTGIWAKSGAARRCRDKIECHICASTGKLHTEKSKQKMSINHIGVGHSLETRKKLSESHIGHVVTNISREKLSLSIKNAWKNPIKRKNMIENSNWKHTKCDKGQLELLDKWNKLGFNFIPNYQIKTSQDLFYVDGYDKKRSVVLECDSKYHKLHKQKQKDLVRQQKIINILKPKKFWRYNAVNKTFENVLE